jgi:hypothetical protein
VFFSLIADSSQRLSAVLWIYFVLSVENENQGFRRFDWLIASFKQPKTKK